MALVPFSPDHLHPHDALPFGVRDVDGRLLLSAGQHIESDEQLSHLRAQALFADEAESAAWRRRLAATLDRMVRDNAPLKAIAQARPDPGAADDPGARPDPDVAASCDAIVLQLDALLRDIDGDGRWIGRLDGLADGTRTLAAQGLDAALYHLIYLAATDVERYSAHHSLLAMIVADAAAEVLGWTGDERRALGRAALTMNVAMLRLQDLLARSEQPPTPDMRLQIDRHAERGARMLVESGVRDTLWIETVRRHHDPGAAGGGECAPRLAALLQRVDMFTAKLSRRRTRQALSPVVAARETCLGAGARPDPIGAALLKAVGLYPPGSFVKLCSGEVGIVLARGGRSDQPIVAALVGATGLPLVDPMLRDTGHARHTVRAAVEAARVRVRPPHERLRALA